MDQISMDHTEDHTGPIEKSLLPTLGLVTGIAATITGIANIPFPGMMLGGAAAAAGIVAILCSFPHRYRPGIGLGVAAVLFAGIGFLITPRSLSIDEAGRRTFYMLPRQSGSGDTAELEGKVGDLEREVLDLRQQLKLAKQELAVAKQQVTAEATPAPEPAAPSVPKIKGVPERLLDTGTIMIGGKIIELFGVVPVADPHHVALLTNFIAAHGRTLDCEPRDIHYICRTGTQYDVAAVALSNGGARASADATTEYRHYEEQARQKRLGIWR